MAAPAPSGTDSRSEGLILASTVSVRQLLRETKSSLLANFLASKPTASLVRRLTGNLTHLIDQILAQLWSQSGLLEVADKVALLAVGGFGRGELFPFSDVDVLVLLDAPIDSPGQPPELPRTIERFITACWDSGIEIGSSVRGLAECLEEGQRDVTIQTALLESRWLCGSQRLFQAFRLAYDQAMDPKAFLRAKTLEMLQRHQKFEETPYALEPHCKESPGGLRDLQVVMWVARAAGFGKTWRELSAKGLITAFEAQQLDRNEGLLKLIRARLHCVAQRREDRLVFDLQTAVADTFGYQSSHGQSASEKLMRRYYWAAKAVSQLNQILMLNMEERINGLEDARQRWITAEFLDRGGMLEVASDDLYHRNPHAILNTFAVYQSQAGLSGLSARTLRALYNARNLMDANFRKDPVNRATFMRILRAPQGQTHALRMMNATSVLGRTLWVFRRIVGQMQHDLFHAYTVDQHILMVVRNVRRFFIPEHAHEYPFCSQLAAQWDKPYILYIAALFHDVAKGRGGDHSVLGAQEARRFCRGFHVEATDAELIEFLVAQHLTLSHIAQKEDFSDPIVIERCASIMKTERRLTGLYLLTVADIRGTSPKVWNAWKGKLLEDLYRLTLRALGGAKPNFAAEVEARKIEARHGLNLLSFPQGIEQPLWKTLDVSYFARHDAHDIAWHARSLACHLHSSKPLVNARLSSLGEGLQVLVYAPDRADLFAHICGYFDNAGFDILDAKVHTTQTGYALDTFQVISPDLEQHHRDLIALVENQLTLILRQTNTLPEPRRSRVSRRVRFFPITPRVQLKPDESGQRWVLTISASDRSGLLYGVARVLATHDINLQLAKITTLGERVEDTFLIDGPALQESKLQLQIESELLDVISAV